MRGEIERLLDKCNDKRLRIILDMLLVWFEE